MSVDSSIPEALRDAVREESRQGRTTRQIAAWLGDAHQVEVSHHAVARLLATQRQGEETARSELQAIVHAHVAQTLKLDLDGLEAEGEGLRQVTAALRVELLDVLASPLTPEVVSLDGTAELAPAEGKAMHPDALRYLRARTVGALTGPYLRAVAELRALTETKIKRGPRGDSEREARQRANAEHVRQRIAELAERQRAEIERRAAQPPAPGAEGGGAAPVGADPGG